MGFLERFSSKVSKEITSLSLPNECKLYLHYVEYNLEGFEFKDEILNIAINLLNNEYTYYQDNKGTNDFEKATNKYDENTFAKDFMGKREHYDCAEALAFLLMFRIVFYYRYNFYGQAFTVFKNHLIEVIKNLDTKKIPESFGL